MVAKVQFATRLPLERIVDLKVFSAFKRMSIEKIVDEALAQYINGDTHEQAATTNDRQLLRKKTSHRKTQKRC